MPSRKPVGKEGRYREIEERERIAWYQWEFLRRNQEYRRDYELFMAEFGDWFRKKGLWYDKSVVYEGKDWEYFCSRVCPRAQQICEKWQITDPIPPDWEFDKRTSAHPYEPRFAPSSDDVGSLGQVRRPKKEGSPRATKRKVRMVYYKTVPTGASPELIAACWNPPQGTLRDLVEQEKRVVQAIRQRASSKEELYRYVGVRFDVTQSLVGQLEQAKRQIQLARRRYETLLRRGEIRKPKTRVKRRRRFDLYDKYLKIWDLRQNGLTFDQIAEQVYPGEAVARQRVWDQYKRAKELICGAYKELR